MIFPLLISNVGLWMIPKLLWTGYRKKLMYFYQWIANLELISLIETMNWRDLNEEKTNERKKNLFVKYANNITYITGKLK